MAIILSLNSRFSIIYR